MDSTPTLPLLRKLKYLEANALFLVPGTGARRSGDEIIHVSESGPDGQWVRVLLTFQGTSDGKPFPSGPVEFVTQQSETRYAVRDGRIVHSRRDRCHVTRTSPWGRGLAGVLQGRRPSKNTSAVSDSRHVQRLAGGRTPEPLQGRGPAAGPGFSDEAPCLAIKGSVEIDLRDRAKLAQDLPEPAPLSALA